MINIESNLSKEILDFLNKESYFEYPLDENKCTFTFKKITSPIQADKIYNYMLDELEMSIYQEWDVVRSKQIIDMESHFKDDPYELVMDIFKYVSRKLINKKVNDELNENIPYLIDCINDDFTKIIFNDYTHQNNEFFNNLLQVYLAGGWPCGWEGEYPEGQLVVFSNE